MNCTHVKDAITELQRYNPDVKLSAELEIDSISPATQCNVSIFDSAAERKMEQLCNDNEDMEETLNRLELIFNDMQEAIAEKDWWKVQDLRDKARKEF